MTFARCVFLAEVSLSVSSVCGVNRTMDLKELLLFPSVTSPAVFLFIPPAACRTGTIDSHRFIQRPLHILTAVIQTEIVFKLHSQSAALR